MSILVAADFSVAEWAAWWPELCTVLPGEKLVREVEETAAIDIALVANPPPGLLAQLPRLRFVQSLWAGVDRLLADPTLPGGIPLARMVDPVMSRAMAEAVLWAVLSLHRATFDYAEQQRRREWRQHPQRRAEDITVGVLGLGEMGRIAAQRLIANGYRVIGWSTRPAPAHGLKARSGEVGLQQLLGEAEIVVNLLPLTAATRGLFDAQRLSAMRDGASLVNFGRGAHVIETDLLDALAGGRLRHAVLDVFRDEPLPPEHAFWTHRRITVLPHVAALTDPHSAARVVARNVQAWRSGEAPAHLVDRERGY